jgi:UDP-3-O-[3-hydroxymyristoyl] glucosamine N-acyltransferase
MGGSVIIKDHANIGDGANLAGGSGVMHDVPAGETWGGFPAKPLKKWLRESAWLARESQKR